MLEFKTKAEMSHVPQTQDFHQFARFYVDTPSPNMRLEHVVVSIAMEQVWNKLCIDEPLEEIHDLYSCRTIVLHSSLIPYSAYINGFYVGSCQHASHGMFEIKF